MKEDEVIQRIHQNETYKSVMELLYGMAEDGDQEAVNTINIINAIIPPDENTLTKTLGIFTTLKRLK
jgi:hypothetical protein